MDWTSASIWCATLSPRGNGLACPEGDEWLVGKGVALAMIACTPPLEHRSEAGLSLKADGKYHLTIGSPEFGNGSTTVRQQIVSPRFSCTSPESVFAIQSDTDRTGYDTGPFGSAGTTVAGKAVHQAAKCLREQILDFAARHCGTRCDKCRLESDAVVCDGVRIGLVDLHNAAHAGGAVFSRSCARPTERRASWHLTFTVSGSPSIVLPGRSRSSRAFTSADAGVVINPQQLRGQVEGAIAQGLGSALYEKMVFRPGGTGRQPGIPELPHPGVCRHSERSEVYFAQTQLMSLAPWAPRA